MSTPLLVKISRDGKEIGTYDAQEAVRLRLSGTLKDTDDYTHEGMDYGGMIHWAKMTEMSRDLVLAHLFPDSLFKRGARIVFNLPLCLLGGALPFGRLCLQFSPIILAIICYDDLADSLKRPATLGDVLVLSFLTVFFSALWVYDPTCSKAWAEIKYYLSPVYKWKLHLRESEGGPPFDSGL